MLALLPLQKRRHLGGSALIMAVICAAIIGTAGAVTLSIVNSKYRAIHQAAVWKESLLSAEAGVEIALNEIRKNLYDSSHAWDGWRSEGDATLFARRYAPQDSPGASPRSMTSNMLLHAGEGGQRSWAQ